MALLSVLRHGMPRPNISFTTITIGVVTFWVLVKLTRRQKNSPPGPWGVPILGCLPRMFFAGKAIRKLFKDWSHKYGPIFSLKLGSANAVILNDFDCMKEMLIGPEFQDRIKFDICLERPGDGLVMSDGRVWQEQRKFVQHHFRDVGVGKSSFEDAIATEAKFLTEALLEHEGKSLDLNHLINNAVSNVISSVSFGQRFDYDDMRFQKVLEKLNENMQQSIVRFALSIFLPFTRFIPMGGSNNMRTNIRTYFKFHDEVTAEHRANLDENNIKDAMDAYLIKIDKTKDTELSSIFNDDNMMWTIGDLFAAGTETTTTTLLWVFLFLLNNPDVEAKVRSQLDKVVGPNRFPLYSDRPNLPYIEALISETLRLGTGSVVALPHVASTDATLRGFCIPKGTIIIPNFYALFTDESKWEDPHVFRPERFLDKEGNFIKRDDFIPFSAGPRLCIGEQLARMELFIFVTYIMQRMVFTVPERADTPTTDGIEGFTYKPQPFEVLIRKCDTDD